jgi:DNA polymerase-3 subunit epsilon
MDFVAIDFETANEKIYSVCSLGIAVVQGGRLAERTSWLIRPPELYFNRFNTYIHGIRKRDVENQPEFNELWPIIRGYLEGSAVIAHNAGFDINALRSVLDIYDIPSPELYYSCTRIISKNTWPGLLSYGLASVAEYLGIEFRHHDAEEDAFASAEIARQACEKLGATSLEDLAERLEIMIGRLFPGGNIPSRPRSQRFHPSELVPTSDEFDPEHPFYGQTVAFTGTLRSMRRRAAMQKIVDAGGACSTSVNEHTNFLVVGDQDFTRFKDGKKTTKLRKAELLMSLGYNIEVLTEDEFLRMLEE